MNEIYRDPLGNEYHIIRGADLRKLFEGIPNIREFSDAEVLYLPKRRGDDDFLQFPEVTKFEDYGIRVRSGMITHRVEFTSWHRTDGRGFTARDISVLGDDWDAECYQVLGAHGWHHAVRITRFVVNAVIEKYGVCEITRAKVQFGENWTVRILELAAGLLLEPLCRLWYVVNMQALHYLYHDDLRLGFLWSEYQQRMRSERAFHRGEKTARSASLGGKVRAAQNAHLRLQIVELMRKYCEDGHSASRAAELAARTGIGTSQGANYQIWKRYRERR